MPVRHLSRVNAGARGRAGALTQGLAYADAASYPRPMAGPIPYLSFDGTARDALEHYREVFGGDVVLHTYAEFGRDDGPEGHIAHGALQGPVDVFASDAAPGEATLELRGILFSLLGASDPATLERWFAALAETGEVIDALALKPWGDHDGQVRDRFGVTRLIGYQGSRTLDDDRSAHSVTRH
ncbi:hypothetical protein GCM10010462_13470 [Microbacterium dextranolyticum]|uniref:Glyoxalase/fosfomycin resistance/dioxygenase domain-containing protein n=2 Tax=Microbacterium dextranolyticum TaxID=36806 RepID=A0A9W6M5I1_9MICO|nr:hypothetical protein GCM10017591_08640 [Microbacterium dextranolyticum]